MIQHVLLFRFRPGATEAERAEVVSTLRQFPSVFPQMRDFALGGNESSRDDRFSHAMTVRFDDWEALDAYLSNRIHEEFVASHFRPAVEERAIASFEISV